LADELQVPHLAERLGLFVIIVMGESVFSVIQALSAHLRLDAGLAAGLGMVLIGALAWTYFIHSAPAFEAGLAALLKARDIIALRDVGMFLPFVLVAGVTMIAAGLATAVEHPESRLSLGALIALFGGLAGFFVAVGLVGIRMHRATRRLIPWMILGAALPVLGLTITLAGSLSATFAVALATAAVAAMTVYAEVQARMPLQLVGQAR
ncbi:MAG: low temperature requirement protein A, partial [Pseudolysinimonas sp.]